MDQSGRKLRKILIIDDECDYAHIVRDGCASKDAGPFDIRLETRGKYALRTALEYGPDLIMLDIVMPDENGVELSRRIHAEPRLSHVPIAFITASMPQDLLDGLGGKVDGRPCLLKPFSIMELVQFVQNAINHPRPDAEAA